MGLKKNQIKLRQETQSLSVLLKVVMESGFLVRFKWANCFYITIKQSVNQKDNLSEIKTPIAKALKNVHSNKMFFFILHLFLRGMRVHAFILGANVAPHLQKVFLNCKQISKCGILHIKIMVWLLLEKNVLFFIHLITSKIYFDTFSKNFLKFIPKKVSLFSP